MISIVDAPSVLGLAPNGVELLGRALHRRDVGSRLRARRLKALVPPSYSPEVDPATGIANAEGIVSFARSLADSLDEEFEAGAFPLVLGGDCSIVLGPLLSLGRRGRAGLLFLDGHADFADPLNEPSGEAASMDLALATGRGPDGFGPIGERDPLIADDRVAVVGYRVHDDGTDTNRGVHVADTGITALELEEVRRRGVPRAAADALEVVARPDLDGCWIHLDVDVLDDDLMPAVDYRNPGGMSWEELGTVLSAAVATGRALGMDVTIFNPTLDPDRRLAERLVALLVECLSPLSA